MRRHWALLAIGVIALVLPLAILTATAHGRCRTHACWHRVSVRRHTDEAWRRYHAHPMPVCTWEPESSVDPATGANYYGRPWARGRYRIRNPYSSAAGKFQILDSTWDNIGGPDYPGSHDAAQASPLLQEKLARVLLAISGPGAWVKC